MQFYWLIKDFKNAHFYQEGSSYFKSILCLEKKWMRNNFQTQKFVKIMVFMSTIWMLNTYFFSSFFSIHILLQVALSTLSRTFLHQTHQFIRYIFFSYLNKGDSFVSCSTITKHRWLSSLVHNNNFVILFKAFINTLTSTLQASLTHSKPVLHVLGFCYCRIQLLTAFFSCILTSVV